ncbi:hypothetical protein [Microbacterium sp. BLY]|uniref:hypothetical protein n=1 Tax=Microbacterium sp. BLY TaxID=2823280 RepID=UPI001B320D96|nr:hypothetical protein [Microbacterium sp. BLY]MBP3978831.1 hypothetical protein [Microbacterium sp. BLY]
MSLNDHPIDDVKPEADLQEQERLADETPDDPEVPQPSAPDPHPIEADPADAAEQRLEVPLDDDGLEGAFDEE